MSCTELFVSLLFATSDVHDLGPTLPKLAPTPAAPNTHPTTQTPTCYPLCWRRLRAPHKLGRVEIVNLGVARVTTIPVVVTL